MLDLLSAFRENLKIFLAQNLMRFEDIVVDPVRTRDLIENRYTREISFDAENTLIIKNIINALDYLKILDLRNLEINDELFIKINSMLAFEQALETGHYRDRNCYIDCIADPIAPPDKEEIDHYLRLLNSCTERDFKDIVAVVFCNLAKMQPFFDGNKRSILFLCNVVLLKKNLGIFFIENKLYAQFQTLLTLFYTQGNTDIFKFLKEQCVYSKNGLPSLNLK